MCKESNQKSLEFVIKGPPHIIYLDPAPEKECSTMGARQNDL